MATEIKGIIAAMVTSMNEDESLNEAEIRHQVNRQIAAGVEFIMNGANHQMNALSTYPFYILGWEQNPPDMADLPNKGDTVVGNDVWIGQNVTILPGTRIGDGAVIGAESVVSGVVEPYTIVAGNPARLIRRRFDQELQTLLETLRRWDRPAEEIEKLIPLLTCGDLEIDPAAREVRKAGVPVELTYKEFELLKLLASRRGMVLSRDDILQAVWDYNFAGETRTVDMHVKTLRQKLGEGYIQTVRGVGYKMA